MPRLNPNFARCVFFLYGRDKTGKLNKFPEGTGVLIGIREVLSGTNFFTHMYAVTCAHVAPQGASVIRINTSDGKSRFIDLEPDDWLTPTNGADVAAADISEQFSFADDVRYLSPAWFVERDFIERVGLGLGEDGFMLGLFVRQPGKERNRVAARFGNVSMLASDDEPISWEGRPPIPAHLFDIRSRGGFSGSPVFVYRTPDGDLRDVTDGRRRRTTLAPTLPMVWSERNERPPMRADFQGNWEQEQDIDDNIFLRLLGIHVAQYPEVVKARKLLKPQSESAENVLRDGDRFVIEGGMTIVVPAWEIRELLNREEFVQRRTNREAQRDDSEPTVEASVAQAAEESARPAIEGDEQHKERFTGLLDAAVGKPKQVG